MVILVFHPLVSLSNVSRWVVVFHPVVALLSALCLSKPLNAEPQSIEIAYNEFAPGTYTSEDGKPAGAVLMFVAELLRKTGYRWTARAYPLKRVHRLLKTGGTNLWIGPTTVPGLTDHVLVSEEPIFTLELRVFSLGAEPAINQLSELTGHDLIVIRGMSYSGWRHYLKDPANKIRLLEANTHISALKMLQAGRAQYLLGYRLPIESALLRVPVPGLQHNTLFFLKVHLILSSKTPNATRVMEDLNHALRNTPASERPNAAEIAIE